MRAAFALVVGLLLVTLADRARAKDLDVVAQAVLGDKTVTESGWVELVVRLTNNASAAARGQVLVESDYSSDQANNVAPYDVAPGATVTLHLPLRTLRGSDAEVHVQDEKGERLFRLELNQQSGNATMFLAVSRHAAFRLHVDGSPVGSRFDPWSQHSSPTTASVLTPSRDPVSGEALLPHYPIGYSRVAAVLIASDELVNLPLRPRLALAEWVLGGGTLAIVPARPEDLRHAVVTSFIGGEASEIPAPPEVSAYLGPASPGSGSTFGMRPRPAAALPGQGTMLKGYQGGNLHASLYGASASYGLGEVHLFAFDPNVKPAVDDPWVHTRVIDVLRRANERQSAVLLRAGDRTQSQHSVRRLLDPNEGSHWAIIVSAILLCIYSVGAGPVSFSRWRKRGRPLGALVVLPVAAAVTFGVVAAIGTAAKGCSGRARHLTVVEAGAGMDHGVARRWRAFFVPSATTLTAGASSMTSVLGIEAEGWREELRGKLVVDRRGPRLTEIEVRPWETMVLREDGTARLGQGIALIQSGPGEVTVVNRSGRRLRGVVLWLPFGGGHSYFLPSLEDGARAKSTAFRQVDAHDLRSSSLGLTFHTLDTGRLVADGMARDLADAWDAVGSAIQGRRDWFPDDVPVLLAQLDGGEGALRDAGLGVDVDRVLVRVVGYGGAP